MNILTYRCREHRGLKPLIKLINTNGPDLLTNVSLALGRCAEDGEALKYIRHLDGIKYQISIDQIIWYSFYAAFYVKYVLTYFSIFLQECAFSGRY